MEIAKYGIMVISESKIAISGFDVEGSGDADDLICAWAIRRLMERRGATKGEGGMLFGKPINFVDGLFPEDASIVLGDWKIYTKE